MQKTLFRQVLGMAAGVALMGFSISWLVPCGFGTDGFTALNLAVRRNSGFRSARGRRR